MAAITHFPFGILIMWLWHFSHWEMRFIFLLLECIACDNSRNHTILFTRLGHTRLYDFFLVLLEHSLLEPNHHAGRKPKSPMARNQDSWAQSPSWVPAQQPAPTCYLSVTCQGSCSPLLSHLAAQRRDELSPQNPVQTADSWKNRWQLCLNASMCCDGILCSRR